MEIHMSYDDNDAQSYVSSIVPRLGQGGRVVRPAQIVVYPFGPDPLAAAAGKVPLLNPGMVMLGVSRSHVDHWAERDSRKTFSHLADSPQNLHEGQGGGQAATQFGL